MKRLFLAHLSKEKIPSWQTVAGQRFSGIFQLETCQRVLLAGLTDEIEIPLREVLPSGSELYFGKDAYSFLLEVITGLKSVVVGETEILAQFKKAWLEQQHTLPSLNDIFQNLITDAKEVRTSFLQNLGAVGYGSLVRNAVENKLTENKINPPVNILLVGAGEIAFSVAPYLADVAALHGGRLFLTNRSVERLVALSENLKELGKNGFETVDSRTAGQLWSEAPIIISAIPWQKQIALEQFRLFGANRDQRRFIVRLAGEEPADSCWNLLPSENTLSLQDLFRQKERNHEKKERKIAEAREFCSIRAKLRLLGGHIAHGWEDLSWFEAAV